MEIDRPFAVNHFSVDCVIFGFDGENLNVLLLHRKGEDNGESFHDMKLPGSLIYQDEDLDEAAKRVLNELTGLKNLKMIQFKAFGSKDRTRNPKDVHWLEKVEHTRVTRIVTVVYLALVKIDRSLNRQQDNCLVEWVPMTQIRLWHSTTTGLSRKPSSFFASMSDSILLMLLNCCRRSLRWPSCGVFMRH